MSTLQERLDSIRTRFREQASPETLAVMDRAKQELIDSGITSSMIRNGDTLPTFALPDTDGQVVESTQLLARGPLVVTLYRGHW